ncbi:MAG: sulfatase [Deltaproteobacteria bacterium]|nr:sulfatase [Deltaproteobacteria bacterium]
MRAVKWLKRLGVGVVVLAGALYLSFDWLVLHVPGWLNRWRNPIAPNREIAWMEGPAQASAPPAERSPNVVVIVADDLGWNDLTWNGGGVAGGTVPTPNIDSLAHDGVDFRSGYTGNATCAPSRAAIMTGRYPTRFGFEFTPAPKAFMRLIARWGHDDARPPVYFAEREKDVPEMDLEGLPPSEITMAEVLRARGYHTVGIGKWHLGEAPDMRPNAQGFDEYLGFLAGAAMFLPAGHPDSVESRQEFDPIDAFLWANLDYAVTKDGGPRFAPAGYLTDYLSDQAARTIEANRNRPFFLYLAYNAPHTPLQALRSDYDALGHIENHTLRTYAAMIRALDRGVGRVLEALAANGLADNTLVIFSSDNGGAHYIGLPDVNAPHRGWKMTFFEGGVHTPFFVRWPRRIPAGSRVLQPVGHVDVFATAVTAAGAPLPSDRPIDGTDLVALAQGDGATKRAGRALYWRSGHYRAIRDGDWKLQLSERPKQTWLFDLKSDPDEKTNLAAARPEQVRALTAALDALDGQMVQPTWPALIEGPIAIDRPLGVPEQPGEEFVYWAN